MRSFSNSFKLLINIGKWDNFIENTFLKMTYFLENINIETNRV